MKLILKKECAGYYSNRVGDFKIVVSENNGEWQGQYTDESKIEENVYLLFNCYGDTKKEVVDQMITFLKEQ